MSIIDHVNLPVSDLKRSRLFYETILEPLGFRFLLQDGSAVGFGFEAWNFGILKQALFQQFISPSKLRHRIVQRAP
jgi:catechol 2,3-dioxygenase-like lactoylglutathione lyase family enzyme